MLDLVNRKPVWAFTLIRVSDAQSQFCWNSGEKIPHWLGIRRKCSWNTGTSKQSENDANLQKPELRHGSWGHYLNPRSSHAWCQTYHWTFHLFWTSQFPLGVSPFDLGFLFFATKVFWVIYCYGWLPVNYALLSSQSCGCPRGNRRKV